MSVVARLSVATFNIRYARAPDGVHAWRHRRRVCLDTIAALDADVVGLQEVLGSQQRSLAHRFGRQELFGVGRDDGRRRGERTSVLVRHDSGWSVVDVRTRWLSPTPEVPGSIGWDGALPRTVTTVTLQSTATAARVVVGNTHFDHAGAHARLESARAVLALAATWGMPWVLVGDLNAGPDEPPLRAFLDAGWHAATDRTSPPTFHAWRPDSVGERIDHIIASPHWEIAVVDVVDRAVSRLPPGPLPSDHWPVRAELVLRDELGESAICRSDRS